MKKLLFFWLLFFSTNGSQAQITTSILKANFGIEGDLRSNYFDFSDSPGEDDWFYNGDAGLGAFVIDTTGAAAIVAGYSSDPTTTTTSSFARGMNQTIYSVVNNKLLMDANFTRDYHGDDSTVFASGSNKNGMSPSLWSCPPSQSVPDKNDILDAFTHIRRDGPTTSDSLWLFGGLSIENTTGNRYFDFELFQTNFSYNAGTQTFSGYGPDAGHTSWVFDASGNIVSPGDIIFTAEFGSAGLTLIEARIWINQSSLSIVPTAFNWGGAFDGDGSGATYGYANITPLAAGAFYTGIQNGASTWAGPYALLRGNNSVVSDYLSEQFMEFSVNLTKLGIDPATYGNACGAPFRSVLIKTRASTSFTSELKDFVAPFQVFQYTQPKAMALINYFCGTMPASTINVINPIPTSQYIWSTTDGNIVGTSTGSTVTVNSPGTYYVTQKLNVACAPLGLDSVKMSFDPVCLILNVNLTFFSITKRGGNNLIAWEVNNNELAINYVIEYSNDNRVFHELANLPAMQKAGTASYDFSQPAKDIPVTYYRIKMLGKNDRVKYSNTIMVNLVSEHKNVAAIFPNPSHGDGILSLESSCSTMVTIYLSDVSGRIIKILKLPVKQGGNLVPVDQLARQSGIYIVKIKTQDGEVEQRLVIQK
jgi:hypothetical protein